MRDVDGDLLDEDVLGSDDDPWRKLGRRTSVRKRGWG